MHTTTALDCAGTDTLESIAYVDGLGRARAALATNTASDWVRSGLTTLDKKGSVRRTYQSDFFGGSPTDFSSVVALPSVPYAVTRYDAFGRARGVIAEDGAVTWTSYHSLSTDVCDPLDNDPSSVHYRTCTTARTDGHGRVVAQVLRNRDPGTGAAETYQLWSYYRADGAVVALIRADGGTRPARWTTDPGAPHVRRTFTYDSFGRRLSSDDPDTDNPADASSSTDSWRYLYNRVNDLVAVRDPRGCGQNFFYDHAGRLRGEQYVSCAEAQTSSDEQPPAEHLVAGLVGMAEGPAVSLDVVYHYDEYPSWAAGLVPSGASGTAGRATGVSDRAQRAAIAYDDRGDATWTARQLALLPAELPLDSMSVTAGRPSQGEVAPSGAPGTVFYDTAHTYTRTAAFDHAGRPTSMTLPTDPDYAGSGAAPVVGGSLTYDARGLPATASATVGAATQPIVTEIEYTRDGLVSRLVYGDTLGGRAATTSTTTYDARRRPTRMTTRRDGAPPSGGAPTLDEVTVVFDQELVWDPANNLTRQSDHRLPSEWPAGHRPQSVDIRHDALYRVIGADFEYTQSDGTRSVADAATDWRQQFHESAAAAIDPMNPQPAAMVAAGTSTRVVNLTYDWDYLANQTEWTDDAHQFYERSLGGIANGNALDDQPGVGGQRPSALYLASDIAAGQGGWVEVDYGAGGNMTAMTVHGQCTTAAATTCTDPGGADLLHRLDALRTDCTCAVEQHYVYRWDDLNRLSEARRYDGSAGAGWTLQVRQRYRYDSANQRVVKQNLEQGAACAAPPATGSTSCERIALYPYPGDFERRGLYRDGIRGSYEPAGARTETQYVVAGARTVVQHTPALTGFDRDHRFVVPVADLIHTSAAVLDVRSGALLEASTYYPNGGRETFLNDDAALVAPEITGFTGKEADEEVGVTYFGERYLVPRLGRWASPDPLHVHAVGGGEALNSYHYVSGSLLQARDPLGLEVGESYSPDDERLETRPEGHENDRFYEIEVPRHAPYQLDRAVEAGYRFFVGEDEEGNAEFWLLAPDGRWGAEGTDISDRVRSRGSALPVGPRDLLWSLLGLAVDELTNRTEAQSEARRARGDVEGLVSTPPPPPGGVPGSILHEMDEAAAAAEEVEIGDYLEGDDVGEAGDHAADVGEVTGTVDRPGAAARRRERLRGIETRPGYDRDEHPPAVIRPDDPSRVSIRHVDRSHNRRSGARLRRELPPDGTRVRIRPPPRADEE